MFYPQKAAAILGHTQIAKGEENRANFATLYLLSGNLSPLFQTTIPKQNAEIRLQDAHPNRH